MQRVRWSHRVVNQPMPKELFDFAMETDTKCVAVRAKLRLTAFRFVFLPGRSLGLSIGRALRETRKVEMRTRLGEQELRTSNV